MADPGPWVEGLSEMRINAMKVSPTRFSRYFLLDPAPCRLRCIGCRVRVTVLTERRLHRFRIFEGSCPNAATKRVGHARSLEIV